MLSNASLSLLFFIVGLCQVCYCVHGRILRFERQATKEGPAAAFSSSNPSPQSQPQPIAALAQTIPPRFAPQNSQAAANINAANVGAADPLPQFHQRPGPAPTPEQAQEQFFSQHSQPQQQPPLLAQQQVPAQQQQQPLQPPPIAAQQQVGVNPLHQDAGHNQPPPVQQPQLSQPTPPQGQLGSAPPSASSIVVTSSSPTSFTEPTPRIVPPPVDRNVDLDGDGALSLKEVQYAAFVHHGLSSSVVENLFKEVDKNKDGYLNSIEFNEIRPLVLAKAENAALRYTQNVDTDHNGLLSLTEAQTYILREYGISNRDVQRIWRLVVPSTSDEMDAVLFSKLRRRIRGMSIRLARQLMKTADKNDDGRIDLREAQMIAFEQEGIAAGDVTEMLASVDDNNDGELNAPELADFERIVRSRAVETAKRALKVVDSDGSGTVTMDEAKKIAFDHYGFDEATLEPFFAQADENEDGQLDAVEFAGFRSVIRARAVKNAQATMMEVDEDGDGLVSMLETEEKARREDDMESSEVRSLFTVADQDRSGLLDRVELADFLRLIRLSAIKYVNEHFKDYDINHDKVVTVDELEPVVQDRYHVDPDITRKYFDKVDVDKSNDLSAGEIVDFRHEIRRFVADRSAREELDAQSKREMAEIEAKTREGSGTHPRRHPAEQTAAAPDSPTPTTISKESKLRTGAGNSPNKASADKNRENDREEDGAGQAEAGEGEGESEEEEKTNGGGGSRTTSSRPLVVTTEASTVASTSAATTTSTPTTTTTTTEPPTTTTTTTTTEPPATTTTVSNSTAASPPSPTMRKHKKGRAQRLRSSVKHRDQPATPVVVEKVVMLENASHPSPDVARTVPIDEQSPAAAAESHITQLPSTEAPSTDASPSPSEPSTTTQLASIRNTSTAEVGAHRQILREPSLPKDSVDSENSIGERKNKRKHRPRPTQSTAAPITAGTVDESSSSPSTYQRTNPTTQVVTESTAGTVVTDAPIASQTQPSTTIPETIHEGTSPTPHQAESETPSPTVVVIENSTPPTAAENQPSDTSPAIQTLTPEAITPQQQNQPVDVDIADSTAAPPSSTTTHSPMKRRKTKKRKQSTPAAPTTTTITTTATFTTVPSTTEAGTTRGDFARGEEGGTEAEESPTEVFEGGSR